MQPQVVREERFATSAPVVTTSSPGPITPLMTYGVEHRTGILRPDQRQPSTVVRRLDAGIFATLSRVCVLPQRVTMSEYRQALLPCLRVNSCANRFVRAAGGCDRVASGHPASGVRAVNDRTPGRSCFERLRECRRAVRHRVRDGRPSCRRPFAPGRDQIIGSSV